MKYSSALSIHHVFGAITLALLLLGQLQKQTILSLPIYLHDFVLFTWILCILKQYFRDSVLLITRFLSNTQFTFSMAILCAWVIIGWILLWSDQGFSIWPLAYSARLILYASSAYLIYSFVLKKIISIHDWGYGLEIFFNLVLIGGFIQFIFMPDLRWLAILGYDDHLGRMTSSLFDPNLFGALLVSTWIWNVIQWNQTMHMRYLLGCVFTIIAIVLTWSRMSYISVLVVMSIIILMSLFTHQLKNKMRTYLYVSILSICIFGITFAMYPRPLGEGGNLTRMTSIQNRFDDSSQAVTFLSTQDFIFGKGLFSVEKSTSTDIYTRPNHAKLPTSLPIVILSGIGIGGTALLVTIIGYAIYVQYQKYTAQIQNKNVSFFNTLSRKYPMSILVILALGIHSLANTTLIHPIILLTFMSIYLYEIKQQDAKTI